MSDEVVAVHDRVEVPPLMQDPSFWGMTATQFLGAFNDNVFKQLVLLLCVDIALQNPEMDYQGRAGVLFAAPFILFSGFAGYLSDRNSKQLIIVMAKIAEIFVMVLGMLAFATGSLYALFAVLFMMGTQSAFFGPGKYGILPELFHSDDLPRANGIILMTTFLAIIFGFSTAGFIKELFGDQLWLSSMVCIVIAIIGTGTSLWIRRTPIARPGLQFTPSSLAINGETCRMILQDKQLFGVLAVTSLFWLIGGVVYPFAINSLGKVQLGFNDSWTGLLAASTGLGIAIGCVLSGRASHGSVKPWLVRSGAFGMIASLATVAALGSVVSSATLKEWGPNGPFWAGLMFGAGMIAIGFSAGFFTVPLQVYLQAKTPESHKGRIIGAMNLVNWIGIALAGMVYEVGNRILIAVQWPPSAMFGLAAGLLIPVAILYRPPYMKLQHDALHTEDEAESR